MMSIDNRVDALRSWRGMRYIKMFSFTGLFLLVLFARGVYLKSFAGSQYFLVMISSFLPCFYPTGVLFLPPDSVCRYKKSDRKGAVFAALALLQSLFGVFLRLIFYLFFSSISSLALSLFGSGNNDASFVPFVFMILNLFFADILFYFSERWKTSPHRSVRAFRRVFVGVLMFLFLGGVGMIYLVSLWDG